MCALEAVARSPGLETQRKDLQNVAVPPPLYGRYLETVGSDQKKKQQYVPAYLERESLPTSEKLASRATTLKDEAGTTPSPSQAGASEGDGTPSVATTKPVSASTGGARSSDESIISPAKKGLLLMHDKEATLQTTTSGKETREPLPPHLRREGTVAVPKAVYSPQQQTSLGMNEMVQSEQEHVVEVDASYCKDGGEAISVGTKAIEAEVAIATPEPANPPPTKPLPPHLRPKKTVSEAAGSSKGLEASRWAPWNCN